MFAVASGWRDRVIPLPDERGMGWGIELDWLDLFESGRRLGIVDATAVEHLGRAGEHYDKNELQRAVDAELAERGLDWSFVRTIATWRPWQRRPRWLSA